MIQSRKMSFANLEEVTNGKNKTNETCAKILYIKVLLYETGNKIFSSPGFIWKGQGLRNL